MFSRKEILRFTVPLLHYCNLTCSYCHVPNNNHTYLDFEIFKKAVDFFYWAKGYYKNLVLYGGEPLLLSDGDLKKIIDYSVEKKALYPEKKIEITLVTNLTTYRPTLEPILEKLDNLCLSIDGMKESHDVNRGMFDVTYKNFQKIKHNQKIMKGATINKVVNKKNVGNFFEDIKYMLDEFRLPISYNAALSVEDWEVESVEELEKQLEKIYLFAEENKLLRTLENFFRLPVKSCPFGTLSMWLDGKVYNCEFIANDGVNMPEPVIDIMSDTLVKESIRDCFYTVTSKRCEREDCLSCWLTCAKFSFQKNTPLGKEMTELLLRVKRTRQLHLKYFKKIVQEKYENTLDMHVIFETYDWVFWLFNFLVSLNLLLWFDTFNLSTNFSESKQKIIKKFLDIQMKKANIHFKVAIISERKEESGLQLDTKDSFVTLHGKYVWNINSEMNSFL